MSDMMDQVNELMENYLDKQLNREEDTVPDEEVLSALLSADRNVTEKALLLNIYVAAKNIDPAVSPAYVLLYTLLYAISGELSKLEQKSIEDIFSATLLFTYKLSLAENKDE